MDEGELIRSAYDDFPAVRKDDTDQPAGFPDQSQLWTSSGLFGPALTSFFGGQRIGVREVLNQAAAMICLDVLSQDIMKARLRLMQALPGGGSVEVLPSQHHMAMMLATEPNQRHTWEELVGMTVYHLGMASNSYSFAPMSRSGEVMEIVPLMSARVIELVVPRSREIFYDVYAGTEIEAALLGDYYRVVPAREMIHIRQRMIDGFYGYSTMQAGAPTLHRGGALDEYGSKMYGAQGEGRGYFQRNKEGFLPEKEYQRVRTELKRLIENLNRPAHLRDPAFLEDGISWVDTARSAKDAEFIAALSSQISATCRLWRIPPHKAMHTEAVKYENLLTMEASYANDTLIPICRIIESRYGRTTLTRQERINGLFYEFDRDALTIADQKLRMEEARYLYAAGIIDKDEARSHMGWNPAANGKGKVFSLAVNTVLVDHDLKVVAQGAVAKEPAEGAGENEGDGDAAKKPEDGAKKALRLVS